ncbi:MAG: multiheme c-type cytochrome [Deltaproteobacteria bacterium]|jgi:nitrate/TMAO reductase-like tetraheme cytochrome c subunit
MRLSLVAFFALAGCASPHDALPLGARSADCGACHVAQAEDFARSAHARSDRSPVLEALLPRVRSAWGDAAGERCERCHAPSHARRLGDAAAERSVTCVSCHAAVGNRGERDGLLAVDLRAPIGGPFGDTEPSVAHATRAAPLLRDASLCGTCHEVTGPSLFVEETLTEHRAASPEPGDPSCVGCHLPAVEDGPIALEADVARPRRSHAFVGIDPPWGVGPEERDRAAEDAAALLRRALTLDAARLGGRLEVRVANGGARHAVPTGVAFFRDVWVDVERAEDAFPLRARVITLGDQPLREGSPVALVTDADGVERRRLAFGEVRAVDVEVPDGVELDVVLRARAFRVEVIEALGLQARADEVPLLEIARLRVQP